MFIPGETIGYRFYIPFVAGDVARIFVSYKQDGKLLVRKTVSPGQIINVAGGGQSYFTLSLTQEESLMFQDDYSYSIQLNVVLTSGARCVSKEMNGSTGIQHIREVVTRNG